MDFFFTVASPRRTLKTLRAPRPLQAAPTTRQGPALSCRAAASHQLPAPAGAQHGLNQGLAPAQHLSSQGLDSLVLWICFSDCGENTAGHGHPGPRTESGLQRDWPGGETAHKEGAQGWPQFLAENNNKGVFYEQPLVVGARKIGVLLQLVSPEALAASHPQRRGWHKAGVNESMPEESQKPWSCLGDNGDSRELGWAPMECPRSPQLGNVLGAFCFCSWAAGNIST